MAPEPFNMDQTFINTYLSNATAKSKTSFVCGHIYGTLKVEIFGTECSNPNQHRPPESLYG